MMWFELVALSLGEPSSRATSVFMQPVIPKMEAFAFGE